MEKVFGGTCYEWCSFCNDETEMFINDYDDLINLECTKCHHETEMLKEDFEPQGDCWFVE